MDAAQLNLEGKQLVEFLELAGSIYRRLRLSAVVVLFAFVIVLPIVRDFLARIYTEF